MPLRELEAEREENDPFAERRLTTRATVDWPGEVDLSDGSRRTIQVKNVSLGGAQVVSRQPLGTAVETHTRVEVGGRSFVLNWTVAPVWAQRNGNGTFLTGLRFHLLPPEERQKLKVVLGRYLELETGAQPTA